MGTAVLGGMTTGTVLAIFYVPMFFALVSWLFHRKRLDARSDTLVPSSQS
ncbi:hypothetical protein [Rhizobium hainanense]|nr:hypothetical protein [Rhizobium hainanense]